MNLFSWDHIFEYHWDSLFPIPSADFGFSIMVPGLDN